MTTAAVMRITPTIAEKYMKKNTGNRPFNEHLASHYATAMARNEWRVNGESVKIGKSGKLLDGQHRLAAVLKCGLSVPMLVVQDVDDDVFDTIDTGKKRSGADVLAIAGFKNATSLSSAARWGVVLEKGSGKYGTITNHQLLEFIEQNPTLHHWTSVHAGCKQLRGLLPAGTIAVFCLAAQFNSDELVADFVEKVETGLGIGKGNPAYELRERMIAGRASRSTSMRTQAAIAMTIKALNAYIEGKKIGLLRFGADEVFPVILGMKAAQA